MRENQTWTTWTPGALPYWPYTRPTRTYWHKQEDGSIFGLRVVRWKRD